MSAYDAICPRCKSPLIWVTPSLHCLGCGYSESAIATGPYELGPNDIARPGEW